MAKRTQSRALTVNERISYPRPGPIVVNVPRPRALAAPSSRKKNNGRRRHSGGNGGSLAHYVGVGLAMGYIDKQGTSIPTIPLLGRAGSLAAILHFVAPKGGFWTAAKNGLATIAAYEMANTGSIQGIDDFLAPQT